MKRLGLVVTLALVSCMCSYRTAVAQYLFIDTDGDSTHTLADHLQVNSPTRLDVWLQTDRNRDGSAVVCGTASAVSLLTYEILLRATGGSVVWGNYVNEQTSMNRLALARSSSDLYVAFGGVTPLQPGKYKLGWLDVTALAASVSVGFCVSTQLSGEFTTAFGSECAGVDGDHTMQLGSDWFDTDGIATVGGGSGADSSSTPPAAVTIRSGIAYFAGNRFTAPFVLSFSGDNPLGVNGLQLPDSERRRRARAARTATRADTLQLALDRLVWADVRIAASRGDSHEAILTLMHQDYATSPLVRTATRDEEGIWVTYTEGPTFPVLKHLSRDRVQLLQSPVDIVSSRARQQLGVLRRHKADLEAGAILLFFREGEIKRVPPSSASAVDKSIRRLQGGETVPDDELRELRQFVPESLFGVLRSPVQLPISAQ